VHPSIDHDVQNTAGGTSYASENRNTGTEARAQSQIEPRFAAKISIANIANGTRISRMDTEFIAHHKKSTPRRRAIPCEIGGTPGLEVVCPEWWLGTDMEVTEGGASLVYVEYPTIWRDVGWG